MSDDDRKKITDRILSLLRLAGNNPSEEEASAAAAKAQELMLRHSIELAEVAEAAIGAEKRFEADMAVVVCEVGGRTTNNWRAQLAWALADSVGGRAVRTPDSGMKKYNTFHKGKMTFFAARDVLPGLVETFHYLDLVLTARAASETRDRPTDYFGEYLESARTWRISWLNGCVVRLRERLQEMKRDVQSTSTGTALAVIDTEVNKLISQTFPNLTHSRNQGLGSASGYAAGRAAGDRIDLGGTKIKAEHGRRALPG